MAYAVKVEDAGDNLKWVALLCDDEGMFISDLAFGAKSKVAALRQAIRVLQRLTASAEKQLHAATVQENRARKAAKGKACKAAK